MFQMSSENLNEYRGFCHNELSANIDSDGGVVDLQWIDCHYWNGTVFPDEIKLPIFSRNYACEQKYQAYGAAFQLYTREATGRTLLHRPADPQFSLSYLQGGDDEQSYELLLDDGRLLWECTCTADQREELLLCINQRYLFSGVQGTHKDHHRGTGTTQIGDHYEEAGVPLNVDLPWLNGTAEIQWTESGYHEEYEALLYHGTITYPYGVVQYTLAFGADAPVTPDTAPGMTVLRMPWGDRSAIRVGMALAHDDETAVASLRRGLARYTELRDAQLKADALCRVTANCVETAALPFAKPYGQAANAYLDSLLTGPMDGGRIGVRASASKYGFFSLWDTIYPIRDFLWNGRYADAARIITYLFHLPAMENTPIAALHLITAWNEAMAFLPEGYLEDMYPCVRKIFDFARRLTEPQYRLLLCKGNTGVDHADQVGLYGMFLSPDVNGLWYNACRAVRNEALKHGDNEVATQAGEILAGVEQGFRQVFFDETVGYLHVGANRDLTPAPIEVYHNSLTLGFDYPAGMYLMRDIVPALAHYQSHELWHPLGHRAVAFDSAIPCDWWRYVHMNQHNGHEMKLQRAADNMAEVHRVMGEAMKRSERWKNAEETTNFSRFAIHPDQVCDWQSFAATAQMEALRSAVAGVLRHRGGLYYLPANDNGDVTVHNVPLDEERVTVTVCGEGCFGAWYCDDVKLEGSLQLPTDAPQGALRICRGEAPAYPVLISALDLPVKDVSVSGTATMCTCAAVAFTPMTWYAPVRPTVTVNGEEVPCEWDEATQRAYVDRLWQAGDRVRVSV